MNGAVVSVVIPSYNCGRFVTEAVESVLAQTVAPREIVVVDDGSRDDTRERLAPYVGRIRYIFQENQGVSVARNRGIAETTGELIAFLDSDDVWHPRKLELQLRMLAEDEELGMLGAKCYQWPGDVPEVTAAELPSAVVVPYRKLVIKNYFATSCVVVRRAVLGEIGGFDSELSGPEDHDLWIRIAAKYPVANLPLPLVGYRTVEGSLGSQAVRMEAGMRRILGKLDAGQGWLGEPLLRWKAYSYCNYSCGYMYAAAGQRWQALARLVRSMLCYPVPYGRGEVSRRLARPRLLGVTLSRLLRRSPPEPSGTK